MFRMIINGSLKLGVSGLAIGVPIAFILMRILASLLVGVTRPDVPILAALTALLAVVAACAGTCQLDTPFK